LVTPQPSSGADQVYENALAKVVERAQGKLQQGVELWTDHSTWDKAREVESKRFRVRTTASYAFGKRLGTDLDGMSNRFVELLAPGFEWNGTKHVHVYPDVASYNKLGEEQGEYHSSIYGCFHLKTDSNKPVVMVFHENLTLQRMYATHGAAHQFVDQISGGRELPTWVSEGLASYFALYWSWQYGSTELSRFQKNRTWIPLKTLLNDAIDKYTDKPHERFIELGMLFSYLLHYRADTKSTPDDDGVPQGPFADYLRDVIAGKSVDDRAVHELLFEDTSKLESAFRANKF
jgi:hypothetical protein